MLIQKNVCPRELLPGQMLHGQISPGQLSSVIDGLTSLPMRFGEDLIIESRDTGPLTLRWSGGRPAGWFRQKIVPLHGSILQVETC